MEGRNPLGCLLYEERAKACKEEMFHLPGGGDCGASIEAIAEMRAECNRGETSVPPIEGKWAHSSVGQSADMACRRSWVQIPLGPLKLEVGRRVTVRTIMLCIMSERHGGVNSLPETFGFSPMESKAKQAEVQIKVYNSTYQEGATAERIPEAKVKG
jgi:hypothetical protein